MPAGSAAKPGLTAGLADCQWQLPGGGSAQTLAADASDWALQLSEVIRTREKSGLLKDEKNPRQLRAGAAVVEAGKDLHPARACRLFSDLIALQGASGSWIVTIIPNKQEPQIVTGQMCSGGKFTSVLVADGAGLDAPLPLKQVQRALRTAHRKHLG